jgi:fused signal recognition particle receptor
MFTFLTTHVKNVYSKLSSQLCSLFSTQPDEHTLKKLETVLLEADTGITTTTTIINNLTKTITQEGLREGHQIEAALKKQLSDLLQDSYQPQAQVYMLVGINGSGKTTTAGKLTHLFKKQGKKVLLVAADTFRAAAIEQLSQWAHQTNTPIVTGKPGQDPSSVIFQGCQTFKNGSYDILIIDTAGRLQTKTNLMLELAKMSRSIERQLPGITVHRLLTIDAMLGQNSLQQARLFNESTTLNGIILTKIDGTGKGGIIFSICHELKIPIAYLSCGEKIEDLVSFEPKAFVDTLFQT